MSQPYMFVPEMQAAIEIPGDGILSRAIYSDDDTRIVLFAFSKGQELTEHTACVPAVLYVVQGDVRLTLGDDTVEASAGACVHMPAELQHGVYAKTPLILLLVLVKAAERSS